MCQSPGDFALALSILEACIKPVLFNPVWNDSLGKLDVPLNEISGDNPSTMYAAWKGREGGKLLIHFFYVYMITSCKFAYTARGRLGQASNTFLFRITCKREVFR